MNQNGVFPFLPASDWVAPKLSELPDLSGAKEIALDLETSDPNLMKYGPGWATKDGFICGVAIAVDGWKGYLPIAHENGENMDKDKVLAWTKDVLSNPDQDKVFANATYDAGWLLSYGIEIPGRWHDVQVAAPLLDEHAKSYSLNALGERFLGEKKSESLMFDAGASFGFSAKETKGNIHVLPPQYVGIYGEQDADLTLRLWHNLRDKIHNQDLTRVFEVESQLLPVILRMRKQGVRVDLAKAFKMRCEWEAAIEQRNQMIEKSSGVKVDVWAAQSILDACNHMGITDIPKTPTGKPSFTSAWLDQAEHPFFNLLKVTRKLSKGIQFLDQIIDYADYGNGRIHAQIHPLRSDDYGTVSGRFSMSSPNLQQIPTRDPEIGRPLRSLFLPEEGEQWISADYKSQETRILMHYVVKRGLADGTGGERNELVEAHKNDPMADFHSLVSKDLNISRFQAKTINLGIIYGMGKAKLADQLGVPMAKAEAILNDYHNSFPFIRKLKKLCEDIVNKHGKITTVGGRACRFPLYEPRSPSRTTPLPVEEAVKRWPAMDLRIAYVYRALNRLIQGSAADQNKAALLAVSKQGITPKITIHDEICVSGNEEVRDVVVHEMENALSMQVPFKVESSMGNSWGDVEK